MAVTVEDRSEIVFFDLETTVPTPSDQSRSILEFGAIMVCPRKLVELGSYSSLVRPTDLSHISSLSARCNGITKDTIVYAPSFADIADTVYDFLHGRIWAGHNILQFDCVRIREAFAEISRPAPEPKGIIDSLALLTRKFGRRAGDMKMETLATYFGLGRQTHRSLDDVRMNLQVLKNCATVLFLESSLPDVLTENRWVSPIATTRSRSNGRSPIEQTAQNGSMSLSSVMGQIGDVNLPMIESSPAGHEPLNMELMEEMVDKLDVLHSEDDMEEERADSASRESLASEFYEHNFLLPDNILLPSISVYPVPSYRGLHRMQISYQNFPMQLQCASLKVRFRISTKFVDHTGLPRLSFVVDALSSLCNILDEADRRAQKLSDDSGSSSEWRPIVTRKQGFFSYPTIRLHLPTLTDGGMSRWATDGGMSRKTVQPHRRSSCLVGLMSRSWIRSSLLGV